MRLMIDLTPEVHGALSQLARAEERHPRKQAALLLRRALEQAGYLPAARPEPPAAREQPKPCAT